MESFVVVLHPFFGLLLLLLRLFLESTLSGLLLVRVVSFHFVVVSMDVLSVFFVIYHGLSTY